MATEAFAANQATTTVSSGGTDAPSGGTQESWTVASSAMFPAASSGGSPPTQFHVADPAAPSEMIAVTNVSGTTWTVTRGAESTTPVAHAAGFTVYQVVTTGGLGGFLQSARNLADVASASAAYNNVSPMTTLGDIEYESAANTASRLAGNTAATKKFLTQTGTGTASAAPAWGAIAAGDVPTLNQSTTGNAATATNLAGGATFPAYVAPTVTTLTDGTAVTINAALGNDFRWALGGSAHTLAAPSNPKNGQPITIAIAYGGSYTPLFNSVFDFGSLGQPAWTATSGKTDYVGFRFDSALNGGAGEWAYQGFVPGLAS